MTPRLSQICFCLANVRSSRPVSIFIRSIFHFNFIPFVCAAVSVVGGFGLHLCKTSVHKQFCSCDEACVIGGKKRDRLGDLIGRAQPAERNVVGDIL
jgi:hypothetical protein